MYSLTAADVRDAVLVARDARQADIDEVWRLGAMSIYQALYKSVVHSSEAYTWWVNGNPVAMGGIVPESFQHGIVWMLGTNEILKHRRVFLSTSYEMLSDVRKRYLYLHNYADANNSVSLRWALSLGFEMEGPYPIGPFRSPAYHLQWRNKQ